MQRRPEPEPERQRKAESDLAALGRERDLFQGLWHSIFSSGTPQISGPDAWPSDPIELWGRRIGRTLAVVAFAGFCLYLYLNYVR
jgi:hypothetical protein